MYFIKIYLEKIDFYEIKNMIYVCKIDYLILKKKYD